MVDREEARMRANTAESANTFEELGQFLKAIKDKAPAFADQVDKITAKIATTFRPRTEQVVQLVQANRVEEAAKAQADNAAIFNELQRDIGELRNGLTAYVRTSTDG